MHSGFQNHASRTFTFLHTASYLPEVGWWFLGRFWMPQGTLQSGLWSEAVLHTSGFSTSDFQKNLTFPINDNVFEATSSCACAEVPSVGGHDSPAQAMYRSRKKGTGRNRRTARVTCMMPKKADENDHKRRQESRPTQVTTTTSTPSPP